MAIVGYVIIPHDGLPQLAPWISGSPRLALAFRVKGVKGVAHLRRGFLDTALWEFSNGATHGRATLLHPWWLSG